MGNTTLRAESRYDLTATRCVENRQGEGSFEKMKHVTVTASSLLCTDLFRALDENLRETASEHCSGFAYESSEEILSPNDPNRDVYFILSGAVRITNFSNAGKQVTYRDQCAGEMFGLLSAVDGQPRSAHVVACESVTIARMSDTRFLELLNSHPQINERVLCHMAALVRSLTDRVTEYGTLSVNQRLYAELLRLANVTPCATGEALTTALPTHAELASRIATHREAVTRELRQLSSSGLIEKIKGDLKIIDVAQLKARLDTVV